MSIIRDQDNIGIGQGNAPPPDAPHEVAQPLTSALIADQLAMARANERELAPFKPVPAGGDAKPAGGDATTPISVAQPNPTRPLRVPARVASEPGGADTVSRGTLITPEQQREAAGVPVAVPATHMAVRDLPPGTIVDASGAVVFLSSDGPLVMTTHVPGDDGEPISAPPGTLPPGTTLSALAAAARQIQNAKPALPVAGSDAPYQPAASQTDSPARGVPQPIADPGKQITGGFGDGGAAQYEPLDGTELKALIRSMFASLSAQLDNDLRFTLALTYPRLSVKVVIEIEGYEDGTNFNIPRRVIHDRTPIEIAREVANEFSFVIVASRREMDADGHSVEPAGAMRAALGVEGPRRRVVSTPGGKMIVDRV